MKKAFNAWMWSLGVVARSYRTVVVLAALIALWGFAAYEWLGLPESSALLLILALVWAVVQLLVTVGVVTGTASGAADAAVSNGRYLPLSSLWTIGRKKLVDTLIFCLVSLVLAWTLSAVFAWVNGHSMEVASFLTFHSEKPVSHVLLEEIYSVLEGLLWVVAIGFLLSFFMVILRAGWNAGGQRTRRLLAGCAFQAPFLTTLLGVAVCGGLAYKIVNWHPLVPAGFWDYSQMIVRFSLAILLVSVGALFLPLSLARLQVSELDPLQV